MSVRKIFVSRSKISACLPAPMMSRMSGWRHVAMLSKTMGVVAVMLSYASGVIAAIGSGPK